MSRKCSPNFALSIPLQINTELKNRWVVKEHDLPLVNPQGPLAGISSGVQMEECSVPVVSHLQAKC